MPAGLHGPDFVPVGAESLFAVGLHPHVDEQRLAVFVQGHAAGVIVVVTVGIAARLDARHKGTGPADPQPYAGIPYVAGSGGARCGKGADFRLAEGGLHHIIEVDPFGIIRVVQAVGVRVGGKVGGSQRHQRYAAHPFAKQKFPYAPHAGQGAAIGKIQVIPPGHMHMGDVFSHVADLGLLPYTVKHAGCQGAQDFQRVEQCQRSMAVVLGALAAAAVLAVIFQETVDAVRRPGHGGADAPGAAGVQQRGGDQAVLGAPGGPVAHGFVAVAHPPEMFPLPGPQDAAFHLAGEPLVQAGHGAVQRTAQQVVHHGQQGAGLGSKQVHHRAGGIGQGQLGHIPYITVVGGQLPGALLADGPDQIGDGGQKFPGVAHAFRHHQPAQQAAAGKVGVFVPGAVAGMGKVQPQVQGQRRNMPGVPGGLAAGVQPPVKGGQGVPGSPVPHRRAEDPAAGGKIRPGGQQFSQHRAFPPWRRRRRAVFAGRCGG